jgi:hypothetical protein
MIKVIASKGLKVPLENNARRYINDVDAVSVEALSAYYQRRLRDGDLLPAQDVVPGADAPSQASTDPAPRKKEG